MIRVFLKILLYFLATIVLAFFLGQITIGLLFNGDDLAKLIRDNLQRETGAKVEIAKAKFHVFSGLWLSGFKFYPPDTADPRGFLNGGQTEEVPLAEVESINVEYQIWSIFFGHLKIKALNLVKPKIYITKDDTSFNFDGIASYRQANLPPPEPEKPEEPKKDQNSPPFKISDLLPIKPSMLFLPLNFSIKDLGLSDLSLIYRESRQHQVVSQVDLQGLSFNTGLTWFGTKSRFWIDLSGTDQATEKNLIKLVMLKISPLKKEHKKTEPPNFNKMILSGKFKTRLEVTNLSKINFDILLNIDEFKNENIDYHNKLATVKLVVSINKDLQGLKVETCHIALADALNYDLNAEVSFPEDNFDLIRLRSDQTFHLAFSRLAAFAKPFFPNLEAGGDLSLEKLQIEGDVVPSKLTDPERQWPHVLGNLKFDDITAVLPELDISLENLSGNIAISGGGALSGKGSQLDTELDLKLDEFSTVQKTPLGEVKVGIKNLSTDLTSRFVYPAFALPVIKFNLEVAQISTSGKDIAELELPLIVSIDGEVTRDLSKADVSARMELGNLLEVSAMADCKEQCQKFRANSSVRLESLENLFALVLPLGAKFGLASFLPSDLSGAIDFQMAARGEIPNPLSSKVKNIVNNGDVYLNTQLNLTKFNVSIPDLLNLTDMDTRFSLSGGIGGIKKQKLSLTDKFTKLDLFLAKEDGTFSTINLDRLSFNLALQNSVNKDIDFDKPWKSMISDLTTDLYLGRVNLQDQHQSFSDISYVIKLTQNYLSEIELTQAKLDLPDFGANLLVKAKTALKDNFLPDSLSANIGFKVEQDNGSKALPVDVKTKGKLSLDLNLSSEDMKSLAVEGGTNFESFSVVLPGKGAKDQPILLVENMNGRIPFKQTVFLPDLDKNKTPETVTDSSVQSAQSADISSNKPDNVEEKKEAEKTLFDADKFAGQMNNYIDKNSSKFAKSTNVVALVDYGNIRPFYPNKKPLSIEHLSVANLDFQNMEFDLELRQNWFALNQYVIKFLGGKIQGDLQLAFDLKLDDPAKSPQALQTSLHLTRLNSQKLIDNFPKLKDRAASWSFLSDPFIDATAHLKYDFRTFDVSGGLEITSIGREQLKMILYYVDPQEQNPSIANIRKALNFGEIRHVSVPIKNGFIGIDVDVRVLSTPIPTPKIQRFPISQLITNFQSGSAKGGTEDKSKSAPLPAPQDKPEKKEKEKDDSNGKQKLSQL